LQYDISTGNAVDYTFTWSYTPNFCQALVFKITDTSGNIVTPSFLVLSTNKITVQTSDPLDVGNYNYHLVGTIGTSSVSTFDAFTLSIEDPCNGASITSATISPIKFDISTTTPSELPLTWTNSNAACTSQISYYLSDGVNSPVTSLTFITIVTNSKVVIGSTITSSDIGTYNLKVHGKIQSGSREYVHQEESFTLTITNVCGSATITKSALEPLTHDISDPNQLIITFAWSHSPTSCPALVFSLTDTLNVPISPAFLSLGTN
jgi:hypothetical protein